MRSSQFSAFQFPEIESSSEDDSEFDPNDRLPDFFHFDVQADNAFEKLIPLLKGHKLPERNAVVDIIRRASHLLSTLPNVLSVNFEAQTKMNIFGDTHGQFFDVVVLLEHLGAPSDSTYYLFNGDFVDRGLYSVELLITLLVLFIHHPNNFFLIRGNHESQEMSSQFGFKNECDQKYDEELYIMFANLFDQLPIAAVVNDKIFVCHGGLFPQDGVTIEDIQKIDRRCSSDPATAELLFPLLWSDPINDYPKRRPSIRGCREAIDFGHEVTSEFLETNKLFMIIRSHQVVEDGYQLMHNNQLVTLFSAPNYCRLANKGAYMKLEHDLSFTFHQFEAAMPSAAAGRYYTPDLSPLSCVVQ